MKRHAIAQLGLSTAALPKHFLLSGKEGGKAPILRQEDETEYVKPDWWLIKYSSFKYLRDVRCNYAT